MIDIPSVHRHNKNLGSSSVPLTNKAINSTDPICLHFPSQKSLHTYQLQNPNSNKEIHTMSLEDTQDLVPSNTPDLSNTVRVTKNDTNLGWSQTLLCKFADVVLNLEPYHLNKSSPPSQSTLNILTF